jgi:hypothetical protein
MVWTTFALVSIKNIIILRDWVAQTLLDLIQEARGPRV